MLTISSKINHSALSHLASRYNHALVIIIANVYKYQRREMRDIGVGDGRA